MIINPQNNDDRCFTYALALTQHYDDIKSNCQKVSDIKSLDHSLIIFIDVIDYPTSNDFKKFERSSPEIVLIALRVYADLEIFKENHYKYKCKYA